MRVVTFSVAPIFPTEFHGGSGRVLADVAVGLGKAGHIVEMFCTERHDNWESFRLSPNVHVYPCLRFKETYPEPFYVPPYQLVDVVQRLRTALEAADVVYIHDGELPFHFLYDDLPTVLSFQDFVYPDTLSNALSFARDDLIVASPYVRDCVIDTIGQYRAGIAERVHVVPNGIDLSNFRATSPLSWQHQLSQQGYYLVGCPHRPDPAKGLLDGVHLVAELKALRQVPGEPMLLIPRWIDSRINPTDGHVYRTLYDALLDEASQLGVRENIHIHEWVNATDMAGYYSGCDVVLAVGSFVEAFGNVPVEAAACGTPAVVAAVAGHVGKLSPAFVTEVPPGDIRTACDALAERLSSHFDSNGARDEIAQRYSFEGMIDGYRHVIEHARQRPPLTMKPLSPVTHVRLAAWCRVFDHRIYHDYLRQFVSDEQLLALAAPTGERRSHASADKIDRGLLERWLKEGYVVPCS